MLVKARMIIFFAYYSAIPLEARVWFYVCLLSLICKCTIAHYVLYIVINLLVVCEQINRR